MFKNIIVAIDLGQMEKARKIIKRAKDLLDEGGEIILLNVVEEIPGYLTIDLPADVIEQNRRHSLDMLDTLRTEAGVSARTEIRQGPAARNILACATDHKADLIIVASHKPDFSNYVLGSTADRVVRHADISVLVDR